MEEHKHYIIDNSGIVGGPFPNFDEAADELRDTATDPEFKRNGQLCIVKVEMVWED